MGIFQEQKSEFLQYHLQNDIQKIQDVQMSQQIEKEYLNAKINKNGSKTLNQSQNQSQSQDILNTNKNNLQKFLQKQHVNQLKLETDTEKQSEFQNDQVQKKQAYQINQEKLLGKIINGNSEKKLDINLDENGKNTNDQGQKSITMENNYDEQYLDIQKDILDSRKNQNKKNIQQEKQQLKQQIFEFYDYNQQLQFQNLNKSDNYLDMEQNQINQQNQSNQFNMRKSLDSRKFARQKSAEKKDSKKQFITQKNKVFNRSSQDFKEIQSALNINQINVQSLEKNNYVNDLQMPEFVQNLKIASNQGSQQADNMHAFLKKYSESQKIQEQNQSNGQNQKEKNQVVDLNFKSKKFINSQRKLKNKSQSNFYPQDEKNNKNQSDLKENKEKINKNGKIQLGHKNEMQSNLLGEIQSQEVNQNLIQQINSDKKQKNQKDEYKNLRANTVGIQQLQYLSNVDQKKQKYCVQGEKLGQNSNQNLNKSAIEFYKSEKLENKDQQETQESQQEIKEKIYQELRNGFLSTFKQKSQQKLQNKSQIQNQNLSQQSNLSQNEKYKQKKESKQKTLEKQFREFGKNILQIKGQNKIGIIRPQSHSLNRKQNLVDGKHKKNLKNTYTLQNYQTQNQNGNLYENYNQIEQQIDFQSLLKNMDFNNFADNYFNNQNQQQQDDQEEIFYHITLDSNLNNSRVYNQMSELKNKNKNQNIQNEKGQKSRNQFRNLKQRKTEINKNISENLIQFDQLNQIQLQQQQLQLSNKEQSQNISPLNKKLLGQINSLTQQNQQLQQEFDSYQKTYVEDNFGYLYKRADLQQRKIEKMNRSCLGSFYKKNVSFQKQQSKNLAFDLQFLSKTEGLENQNQNQNQKIMENSLENGTKKVSNEKQNQENKKSVFHMLKTQISDNSLIQQKQNQKENFQENYYQTHKNKHNFSSLGQIERQNYNIQNQQHQQQYLIDLMDKYQKQDENNKIQEKNNQQQKNYHCEFKIGNKNFEDFYFESVSNAFHLQQQKYKKKQSGKFRNKFLSQSQFQKENEKQIVMEQINNYNDEKKDSYLNFQQQNKDEINNNQQSQEKQEKDNQQGLNNDIDIDQYLQMGKGRDKGVFEESIYKMKNKIVSEGFLQDQLKKQEIFINSQKKMLKEEIQRKQLIEKYEKNKINKEQQNMNLETEDSDKSLKLEKCSLNSMCQNQIDIHEKNQQMPIQNKCNQIFYNFKGQDSQLKKQYKNNKKQIQNQFKDVQNYMQFKQQKELLQNDYKVQQSDQQWELIDQQLQFQKNQNDDENNYQNDLNIYNQQFENQIQQQQKQQGLQKIENKEYMKKKYKVSELYPSFLPKKGINQNISLVYQQNQNEY